MDGTVYCATSVRQSAGAKEHQVRSCKQWSRVRKPVDRSSIIPPLACRHWNAAWEKYLNSQQTKSSLEDTQRRWRFRSGHLAIARLNRQKNKNFAIFPEHNVNHQTVGYHAARQEEDLFLDQSLLDPIDADQHGEFQSSVAAMLKLAGING